MARVICRGLRLSRCLGYSFGRTIVAEPVSISSGIAERYATAVLELAEEGKALSTLEADVGALKTALAESADLQSLIASPLYSRDNQTKAIAALAAAMGLSDTFKGTLGVMAEKRRLFVLPQLLAVLAERIAEAKGEVTADVTAAKALTKTQSDALAKSLKAAIGKTVNLNVAVDESLIGGMIVKIGSRMIDTSIKSKLAGLENAMKGVR
jgi:F-type H+-transporting ATPase subunit delta